MTHLSLFTGIGGLDLAAEWAGFETVGQCEWADYPTKILEKHWPDVPRWRDIRTLTGESFYERTGLRTVDVISGGFPCQPFSVAGKQKGKGDDRYLWPEMLRVIRELKPRWVVGENVPGIIKIAGKTVCEDLEREGYAVTVFNFEAAAVGAPHRRDRVFFVANSRCALRQRCIIGKENDDEGGRRASDIAKRPSYASGNDVADSESRESWENLQRIQQRQGRGFGSHDGKVGFVNYWWSTEPDVGRSVDGFSDILDGIGGISDEAKTRGNKILRNLRSDFVKEDIQWSLGGFQFVSKEEILLAFLCEYEEECFRSGIEVESGTVKKRILRNLWRTIESARASYRREYKSQYAREYSNALLFVSHGAPSLMPQAWENGSWEDGIERVAAGVKNRVDRLKCLGNAVVPQQAYPIFAAIAEVPV